jgi:hypothetical protein
MTDLEYDVQFFDGADCGLLDWSKGSLYMYEYRAPQFELGSDGGLKPAALICSKVTGKTTI